MSEFKGSIRSAASEAETDDLSTPEEESRFSARERSRDYRRRMRRQKRKRRRQLTLAVLPTLLTLGNGVCGLAAIAVAVSVNVDWYPETKLMVAGLLIFAGMLFDALDGSAARMTGQESEFGAQLDSLCDAITFGTAPAVLVWRFNSTGHLPYKLTWAIGVLFALCVLIRLARFNVETDEDDPHEGFEGLPSPAAAGTLAAFAIAAYELSTQLPGRAVVAEETIDPSVATTASDVPLAAAENPVGDRMVQVVTWLLEAFHYLIPVLALMLAFLMVSRYQYPHLVHQLIRGRRAPHQIGQALFILIGAFLFYWLILPMVFCYYAFRAPIAANLKRFRERGSAAAESN